MEKLSDTILEANALTDQISAIALVATDVEDRLTVSVLCRSICNLADSLSKMLLDAETKADDIETAVENMSKAVSA